MSTSSCHVGKKATHPQRLTLENQRILFLGNSITQNGLYVSLIEYALRKSHPNQNYDLISIGLGSETVSCLTEAAHPFPRPCLDERLGRALDSIQPTLVFACYGMNDGIYHPLNESGTQAFREGILQLKQQVNAAGADLVLLTPPPFDPIPIRGKVVPLDASDFSWKMPYENYDEVLSHYSKWLMSLRNRNQIVIDWHSAINKTLEEQRKTMADFSFTKDGIHPGEEGHLLMARLFLEALQYKESSQLLQSWKSVESDTLFQQVHQQRQMRSDAWLKYVGYIRGERVKIDVKPAY